MYISPTVQLTLFHKIVSHICSPASMQALPLLTILLGTWHFFWFETPTVFLRICLSYLAKTFGSSTWPPIQGNNKRSPCSILLLTALRSLLLFVPSAVSIDRMTGEKLIWNDKSMAGEITDSNWGWPNSTPILVRTNWDTSWINSVCCIPRPRTNTDRCALWSGCVMTRTVEIC